MSAYNNRNDRDNLISQTDLTWRALTGGVGHTVLAGVELGRQVSHNLRNTGFFDNVATTVTAPLASPTISRAVTYRPGETDADNRVRVNSGGVYLQDQMTLTPISSSSPAPGSSGSTSPSTITGTGGTSSAPTTCSPPARAWW